MSAEALGMTFFGIVGALIVGIICGFICKSISSRRGMDGGFWWGFFLGIIGVIVVAVKPSDNNQVPPTNTSTVYEDLEKAAKLKEQGIITEDEFNKMKADCLARM